MLGMGVPRVPQTLPDFDAQNRAIRPISMRGRIWQRRIAVGGAVGTNLGIVRGRL